MGFETSTTSPGSPESAYFVRSTVLDGEVLTRVDQSGNKKVTHVPTFGLLMARQVINQGLSIVGLSNRNPHGTTETSRNVLDPLGNYVHFKLWETRALPQAVIHLRRSQVWP